MPNLIYINNGFNLKKFEDILGVRFNSECQNYNLVSSKLWYTPHFPLNRTGKSDLWDLHLLPAYSVPTLDVPFTKTFEEITDARAIELEKLHESTGKPIVVNWSGGIDSTTAVAAIFKNFKPQNRKNITVLLNNYSYFENPVFFNKIIKDNFNYSQIEKFQADPWIENIVVSGEPADEIWIHADILEILHRYPGNNKKSIRKEPDILIKFLSSKSNLDNATWFYETVLESIKQSPVPVDTYEDFYWWTNFNFYMAGDALKAYFRDSSQQTPESFDLFQQHYIPWFLTNDYQRWSMVNNSNGIKISDTIQSYKKPAKEYIFKIDNNPYYYHYKTKTGSFGQYNMNEQRLFTTHKKTFAVYDNGSIVKFTDPLCYEMFLNNQKLF